MTDSPIDNLRIHFYGVQGSGSTFPAKQERQAFQRMNEFHLLQQVLDDLASHADADGRLACSLEDLLGGQRSDRLVMAYRDRFAAEESRVYGGWTTCVRIETADGDDIVLDCGSGFRNCARDLQVKWGDRPQRVLHVFGSHSHLDHTEGFDQAAVCFDPRNTLQIYGNRQFLNALDINLGIFTHQVAEEMRGVQTPLFYALMPATFSATRIYEPATETPDSDGLALHDVNQPIRINQTTIQPFFVFHPAPCLAYRIERGGKVFVFCTDHELRRGDDTDHPDQVQSLDAERRLIDHATNADVMYRDGQYFRAEYDGVQGISESMPVPRRGWGHSCIEDVVEMAEGCNIKQTLIGHHDPNRSWEERNWIDESLARNSSMNSYKVQLARAETVIDL